MTLNKKSIQWHEEGLKNTKQYLEREILVLEQQQKKVQELINSINHRTKQIEFAKWQRMSEFDEESKAFRNL